MRLTCAALRVLSAAAALALAACSESENPAGDPTPRGVRAFTSIDFAKVANYSTPRLPPYFDQTVGALDNRVRSDANTDRAATLGWVLYEKAL